MTLELTHGGAATSATWKPIKVIPESIRRYANYDPITGRFFNPLLTDMLHREDSRISIGGQRYSSAPLAWWFVHGVYPAESIRLKDVNAENKYAIDNLYTYERPFESKSAKKRAGVKKVKDVSALLDTYVVDNNFRVSVLFKKVRQLEENEKSYRMRIERLEEQVKTLISQSSAPFDDLI